MEQDSLPRIGNVEFKRVFHTDSLTGENDYFGCLLADADGRICHDTGGWTWLYSGSLVDGIWDARVRRFNLFTLVTEPAARVLAPEGAERWTAIHLVITLSDDLTVAFYSTGDEILAALSPSPQGPFVRDPNFALSPSGGWETGSLEIDGGFVPIEKKSTGLKLWLLYDNLGEGTSGQNGWAEVHISLKEQRVSLVGRHPDNPLKLMLPDRLAARTGGNLDRTVRIDGRHPLFYLSKPSRREYRMALALSDDPLFQTVDANVELEGCLGNETFLEKQQFYMHNGLLNVIYEAGHSKTDCRTGLRRYRLRTLTPEEPVSQEIAT